MAMRLVIREQGEHERKDERREEAGREVAEGGERGCDTMILA